MWLPGGCTPSRACAGSSPPAAEENGPTRFGYHGALGPHSGVQALAKVYLESPLQGPLEICGYGRQRAELAELARRDARLKFHGLVTPQECLEFGRRCDVLVNPRPLAYGNQNNFASKLFDYALSGSAILTSKLSGAEAVLGPEAAYFDPARFESSLASALSELAAVPRAELRRRGKAIQQRVLRNFSWAEQGQRLAEFLEQVAAGAAEERQALAA